MPSADRLIDIFNEAKALPDANREAFVAAACGPDAELKAQVLSLLQAHQSAGEFLQSQPALSPEIEAELARLKPEEAGERIGPYKLREQIGEGGFGVVWVAENALMTKRCSNSNSCRSSFRRTPFTARSRRSASDYFRTSGNAPAGWRKPKPACERHGTFTCSSRKKYPPRLGTHRKPPTRTEGWRRCSAPRGNWTRPKGCVARHWRRRKSNTRMSAGWLTTRLSRWLRCATRNTSWLRRKRCTGRSWPWKGNCRVTSIRSWPIRSPAWLLCFVIRANCMRLRRYSARRWG